MSCSLLKVKKEEEPEDSKVDIKVKPNSSLRNYSSLTSTTNDIKPVIIKHEIKEEEYDSDCDCNDCRVGKAKVTKITTNDSVPSTQNQTDKHDDDCGCSDCVQDRQVGGQVTDQAHQVTNDRSICFADQSTGDDASRSSTPDWMPSIFSDDDETEDDDETSQDESDDDDDHDHDFSVNDEQEIQNNDDYDDSQKESDNASSGNHTPVAVKRKRNESKGKSRINMEAKYKCLAVGCTKAFKDTGDLKRHTRVHTRERPFACTQCESKFSTKGGVTRHVKNVHLQTKQWRCIWPKCKHRSGYRFNLVEHIKVLHFKKSDDRDPNEYIKKCEEVTSDEEEESRNDDESKLKSNFITVHLNCLDCSETFKTREELKGHLLTAHRIQRFRCLVKDCLVSFEERKQFIQHRSVKHRSCLTWPCHECGNQMQTYHNLTDHFRLHHQKGRFVCAHTGCTVETGTIFSIATHSREHKSVMHRCSTSECNIRFKKLEDLLEHERTHTRDRPFACTQCDKRYAVNGQLNKHIRAKHQSRKPYRCKWENCKHEDGYVGDMLRHVRAHFEKAGDDVKREANDFIERHYEPVTTADSCSKETR